MRGEFLSPAIILGSTIAPVRLFHRLQRRGMQPVSVRRWRFYFLAVFCSILPTACGPNLPDQTPIANSRGPLVLPAGPRCVAILDFWTASKDPETTWLAYAVPATPRAKLGAIGAVSPVDRDWLQETIREHRRRPIDLVDPRKAIILGRLVGARRSTFSSSMSRRRLLSTLSVCKSRFHRNTPYSPALTGW